jgi:hypothetical protein
VLVCLIGQIHLQNAEYLPMIGSLEIRAEKQANEIINMQKWVTCADFLIWIRTNP